MQARIRRRHLAATWALVALLVVEVALVLAGGHRGQHMARDLIVPGAGVIDEYTPLGIGLVIAAVAATVLWLRWGADWLVAAVVCVALACSALLTGTHDAPATAAGEWVARRGAHEFPLVVLVAAMVSWLRSVLVRVPGVARLRTARRRTATDGSPADALLGLSSVDRCRATVLMSLASAEGVGDVDPEDLRRAAGADDVARRARRIGLLARGRSGADPFHRDHSHARAARLACGLDGAAAASSLAADAARSPMGLPCAEPGWVRPLDATLAALVLHARGDDTSLHSLRAALEGPWQRRGRRRPAWTWTPAMVSAGTALPWEHATTTALARAAGALAHTDDLELLRRRMLGAAARHTGHPDDERLVAAARLWLTQADDPELRRVVERRSPGTDPMAAAITAVAAALAARPTLLRP